MYDARYKVIGIRPTNPGQDHQHEPHCLATNATAILIMMYILHFISRLYRKSTRWISVRGTRIRRTHKFTALDGQHVCAVVYVQPPDGQQLLKVARKGGGLHAGHGTVECMDTRSQHGHSQSSRTLWFEQLMASNPDSEAV